jgi:hypothetical protein
MRLLWPVLLGLPCVLLACVPATTPPQLDYTPGPPVVIAGDVFTTAAFTVTPPEGWRVITSAADAPPGAIFVSPDDSALIFVTAGSIGEPPRPQVNPGTQLQDAVETIDGGGISINVYTVAPQADWPLIEAASHRLISSLQTP